MLKPKNKILIFSFAFSAFAGFFYYFLINLPTDAVVLFLPNKLFLGYWLKKGIIPLYNPYIFLGTPFLFDIGLGNLHPFNLLFLFPYPLSLSLWVFATTFIFSLGFLKLFYKLSKDFKWALFLFLILFFSGQGVFIRMNNPTMWAVISHWGFYLYSLEKLKRNKYLPAILWGTLMLLAGHFQMGILGIILGLLFGLLIYKIHWKKLLKLNLITALIIFPYLLLSLPIILESTRINLSSEYSTSGSISPFHLLQVILPFIFGNIREGASWFVKPVEVIATSITIPILSFILIANKKIGRWFLFALILLFLSSFGLFWIPFLRNLQQVYSIIFILTLAKIAQENNTILSTFNKLVKSHKLSISVLLTIASIILIIHLAFKEAFVTLLKLTNRYPHPFFDPPTISAIKFLLLKSLFLYLTLALFILAFRKKWFLGLITFTFVEGIVLSYFHNLFIPQRIIKNYAFRPPYIKFVKQPQYKVQSVLDVYPYTGIHAYLPGVLQRPPFSKEKDFFENELKNDFPLLKKYFSGILSDWNMLMEIKSIQGYSTFVPKNLAKYFTPPSPDYKEKYAKILARNPLLGGEDKGYHINYIETSRITFSDPRWENLGVKYIISPFPLENYNNLEIYKKTSGFYIYKTKKPKPSYTVQTEEKTIIPTIVYEDPNKTILSLPEKLKSPAKLTAIEQPGGKVIKVNNRRLSKKSSDLSFSALLPKNTKTITIYYSPLQHLREVIKR